MYTRSRGRALNNGCLWIGLNLMFAIFLAVGGWIGFGSWRLVQTGETTSGEVVELSVSHSDDGTTYAPIVEYVVDGDTYRYESHNYSSPPAYHVGQRVEILYNPADPATAQINRFWELWILPIIFIPIAVIGGLILNVVIGFTALRGLLARR